MSEKYLMFSMEDDKIGNLAKVLGNKTCKKILDYLAENKEKSEEDIAKELGIPINTAEYNLKMLLHSGLVEKSKNFFWSRKGKKIPTYRISNKSILISPKSRFSKLKMFLPAAIISIFGAFALKQIVSSTSSQNFAQEKTADLFASAPAQDLAASSGFAQESIRIGASNSIDLIPVTEVWAWFLLGVLYTTIIFIAWNWRRVK